MELKDKYEIFYAGRGELSSQEWGEKRAKFNNYALCVKHSLIQDEKWHKLHNSNFSATFYISDELKTEGNLYYEDGNYNEAITLYEQVMRIYLYIGVFMSQMVGDKRCRNERYNIESAFTRYPFVG